MYLFIHVCKSQGWVSSSLFLIFCDWVCHRIWMDLSGLAVHQIPGIHLFPTSINLRSPCLQGRQMSFHLHFLYLIQRRVGHLQVSLTTRFLERRKSDAANPTRVVCCGKNNKTWNIVVKIKLRGACSIRWLSAFVACTALGFNPPHDKSKEH